MDLAAADLAPVQLLYDRGLFVQALRRADELALPPLRQWRGAAGRVLAARLASRLGARRLADALFDRARREHPSDAGALVYHLHAVLHRRGPFAAWERLRTWRTARPGPGLATDAEAEGDVACLRAVLLAWFRDFDAAHAELAAADRLTPGRDWVHVQHAVVLEQQDRCEAALEQARQALAVRPAFVPAAMQAAHLLQVLGRDAEALALLSATDAVVESFELAAALSLLHEEIGDVTAALAAAERVAALTPLAERPVAQWLAARRCDLSLRLGQRAAAQEHAAAVGSAFYTALAQRLADPDASAERVVLAVPFVRQHHMTCGPATLVALAQTFGRNRDHLQVADEICYGGTSAANSRRWALRNGFAAREFTLTVDDAHALLRSELPFAVATAEATSGHLQAVIGFDALRGTLLVRDPSTRGTREWAAREFLQHYRACGPRALLLVPAERRAIALPPLCDEALHDADFAIQEALVAHDYARALAAYHDMLDREPEHPLTIQARWALSAYERDPVGALACIERLLALFPDDQRLLLRKVWCLSELEHGAEVVTILEQVGARRGCDPVFLVMLAEELRRRPGGPAVAHGLLRRALRRQPTHARAHFTLGLLGWQSDDHASAGESLRFAACLDETNDDYALAYFGWCRGHGDTATGLAFLRERHERWRLRAGGPSIALYRGLLEAHLDQEAAAVLASARAARPDDGDLLLAAAEEALRLGDLAEAEARLAEAEGKAFESRRVAALADVAERAGDRERALRSWRSIVAREPLNLRARVAVFEAIEVLHGRPAALADLDAAVGELPFARQLRRFHAHQLGRDDPIAAVSVLADILDDDPSDAWAHRELAWQLAVQGRLEDALAASDAASRLDGQAAAGHAIAGRVLLRLGRTEEARRRLQQAIERDVDSVAALADLWEATSDAAGREELCASLLATFSARAGNGPGLRFFAEAAAGSTPSDRVRQWLTAIWEAQPHARAASSALVEHLLRTGDVAAARVVAERACATFPLDPRAWLDRAAVARAGSDDDERAVLERARLLAPTSPEVAWYLAGAFRRLGRQDEARRVLEAASAHGCDANIQTLLAEVHAGEGAHDAAVACARRALQFDCQHEPAWSLLHQEAQRRKDPSLLAGTARALAEVRPHDPRVHIVLATVLARAGGDFDERRQALDRAIALDRGNPDPYDLRAELLAEVGQFDAAAASLDEFGAAPPANLRGRRAWIAHAAGRRDEAIAAMRAVLEAHPFYVWGWRQLLEWLHAGGGGEALSETAAAYARHRPGDSIALGWVGEAQRLAGRRQEAKAAWMQALRLDPGYAFAADRLCVLNEEDGDLDAADANLALLERTEHGGRVRLLHVKIASRRRDRVRAEEHARRLCVEHPDAEWALRGAAEALLAGGLAAPVRSLLAPMLREPSGVGAAVLVARTLSAAGAWAEGFALLADATLPDPVFTAAASTLLDDLGESADPGRVRVLLRGSTAERLRGGDETWGKVAYCLNAAGKSRATVTWLADWSARPRRRAWMLTNLAHALRRLGRFEAAHAVSVDAVALPPEPGATDYHHVWLAFDAAAAGDHAGARTHLAAVGDADFGAHHPLVTLVRGLLAAGEASPAAARRLLRRAVEAAGQHATAHGDRTLRHAVRAVVRAQRRRVGLLWLLRWG